MPAAFLNPLILYPFKSRPPVPQVFPPTVPVYPLPSGCVGYAVAPFPHGRKTPFVSV